MDFDGLEETVTGGWRQFISDSEGPITRNDNAFELCREMIENGANLFRNISQYDDIVSNIIQRPNYKAGDTLKLILPFLKAYGATDSSILEYSRKNIVTIPGAKKTMRFVQEFMTPFIVATSYEHFISALCEAIGFPLENTYSTALDMDSIKTDLREVGRLKAYAQEIARMEEMRVPENARSIEDLRTQDRATIQRLDDIFMEDLMEMSVNQLLMDVNPVGGEEKASAVMDIRRRTGIGLEDTMYIGDSITDVQAFQLVREGGGLSISFNGNEYALREAEIAVIADNTIITSILAEAFHKAGVEGTNALVEDWTVEGIRSTGLINEYLLRELLKVFPDRLPTLARVTPKNIKALTRQSLAERRLVRGEVVGGLG